MRMKKLIPILIFLICLPAVLGALQVKSFSCDSSVAVDGNLNCQAEITDTSSSATINNVILYLPIGDEWAERASYTGSGYKSSISQGEATTATFSITPVISGEHSFDYIKIDDITDTNIDYSSIKVSVLSIRDLDINAPAYASGGEEFTVSSSVLAGGNLESVQLVMSIHGGCSLKGGESSTKSLGAMADGTQGSKSWTLNQGTGGCSFTVTATASGGLSRSAAGSVGGPSSGIPTGGGQQPEVTDVTETATFVDGKAVATFNAIEEGRTGTMEIPDTADLPFKELVIKVKNKVTDTKLEVYKLSKKPSDISEDIGTGITHSYIQIDETNIEDSDIDTVTIKFKVPLSWINENNIDKTTVVLNRYAESKWNALTTAEESEDATYIHYSAASPGLSVFGISGGVQEETKPISMSTETEAPKTTASPNAPISQATLKESKSYIGIFLVIIAIVVITRAVFFLKKK